jgi:phosphoribosylformylglycinamidine synthase
VVEQGHRTGRGAGQPVSRVERGLRIDVRAGRPMPPPSRRWSALHDPMTQSVLETVEQGRRCSPRRRG